MRQQAAGLFGAVEPKPMLFDLGGNAVEWVAHGDGFELQGGCAIRSPDPRTASWNVPPSHCGTRVAIGPELGLELVPK